MQHGDLMVHASGTLLGHVAGGGGFLIWGLWWLAVAVHEGEGRKPGSTVESGLVLPIMKIAFVVALVWAEVPNRGWTPHDTVMSVHHMTAYSGVAIAGLVDLLARAGRVSAKATHVALAAAMFNLAFLFAVHGNPPGAEAAGHLAAELAWVAIGLLALLEIVVPHAGVHWFRIAAMILSGTWVLTLAWILYVSGWDLADPLSTSWTYLAFSWNAAAVAVLVLLVRLATERSRAPVGA